MFGDGFIENGKLWYFDSAIQALCTMNLQTYLVEIICFYLEGFDGAYKIFRKNRSLFIASCRNPDILKYDLDTHQFKLYQHIKNGQSGGMACHFMKENMIWMLPCAALKDPIIGFNVSNGSFEEKDSLKLELSKKFKKLQLVFSGNDHDKFYAAISGTKDCFCFEPQHNRFEWIECDIGNEKLKLNTICFDGKTIWVSEENNNRIIGIEKENKFFIAEIPFKEEHYIYSRILDLKQMIIGLPRFGEQIVFIDKITKCVHCVKYNWKNILKRDYILASKSIGCIEDEDYIYILPWGISKILKIKKKDFSCIQINAKYKEKMGLSLCNQIYRNRQSQFYILFERIASIKDFIACEKRYKMSDTFRTQDHLIGVTIYTTINSR